MSRRYTVAVVLVLFTLLLAACGGGNAPTSSAPTSAPAVPTTAPTPAPTNTPVPTNTPGPTNTPALAAGAACVVGTWEFSDMSEYFGSLMSQAGNPAQYEGQEGKIIYTFGADGKAKIEAQDFTAKLKITVQNLSFPMEVKMTGSATADYTTSDPNKVTFSNNDVGNFKLSITMNGQEMSSITSDELAAFGLSSDPKYNTFTYECSGDTLKYTPPLPNVKPVVLKRVN